MSASPVTTTMTVYLLTGDIGGTNSRMSLYAGASSSSSSSTGDTTPLVVKYYRNAEHLQNVQDPAAFQKDIIVPFLKHCWMTCNELVSLADAEIVACLATAGLVLNNRVRMTNLGNLLVDGTAIQEAKNDEYLARIVRCQIINDFVAQGYGCLTLDLSASAKEVLHLHGPKASNDAQTIVGGPKVCVGAGTGLGECFLTPDNNSVYSCFASEGGHVEYAPRNDLQVQLWTHLRSKFGGKNRISVERVVSGKGLANVYEFLANAFPNQVDQQIHREFLAAGDEQGRVVGENASVSNNSLCSQAMNIMMSAYGCEVGAAAMKWIPTGGLFVTGGLTPKNIKFIKPTNSEFLQAYLDKGRVSPLLEQIPLYAVLVEDLGVRGAHKAATTLYEQHYGQSGGSSKKRGTWASLSAWLKEPSTLVLLAASAAVGFAVGRRR